MTPELTIVIEEKEDKVAKVLADKKHKKEELVDEKYKKSTRTINEISNKTPSQDMGQENNGCEDVLRA